PELDERADQVADHVMEKAVGRDENDQQALPRDHARRADRADGRSVASRGRAKCREIVFALHRMESADHRRRVQPPWEVPCIPPEKWVSAWSAIEDGRVAIA